MENRKIGLLTQHISLDDFMTDLVGAAFILGLKFGETESLEALYSGSASGSVSGTEEML